MLKTKQKKHNKVSAIKEASDHMIIVFSVLLWKMILPPTLFGEMWTRICKVK